MCALLLLPVSVRMHHSVNVRWQPWSGRSSHRHLLSLYPACGVQAAKKTSSCGTAAIFFCLSLMKIKSIFIPLRARVETVTPLSQHVVDLPSRQNHTRSSSNLLYPRRRGKSKVSGSFEG